jgi:hypothetical protein
MTEGLRRVNMVPINIAVEKAGVTQAPVGHQLDLKCTNEKLVGSSVCPCGAKHER